MTFSWPAIKKEVRMRMRGKSIFIIENLYLLFLGAITVLIVSSYTHEKAAWEIGQRLFGWTATAQILILVFISPTITASAITLERDQKTYDILRSTPLSPPAILIAKLMACLSTFFILALISVPIISSSFILGGISPRQIIWAYLLTLVSMFLAGLLGLYLSTVFRRTLAAIPVSGVIVIVFLIGTGILSNFSSFLSQVNPIAAFNCLRGSWVIKYLSTEIPFWVPFLLFNLLLSFWLYSKAVENLKPRAKRNYVPSGVLLLLVIGLVLVGVFGSADLRQGPVEDILRSLRSYGFVFFLLVATVAGFVSAGYPTFNDYLLAKQKPLARFFSLKGWFGCSPSTGTKFGALVAFIGFMVFLIGLAGASRIEDKLLLALSWFFPVCFFSTAISLTGRILSMKKRTQGRFLPRIIAALLLSILIFGPPMAVSQAHKDELEPVSRSVDALHFFSPMSSIEATFCSEDFYTAHPFLKKLLGSLPFAAVTSLIYLLIALPLFFVSEKLLARLSGKRFRLRAGSESL